VVQRLGGSPDARGTTCQCRRTPVGEWAIWPLGIAVADLVLATGVTIHAVLWKRDSRSVIGWVGLAWLAPFVGAFAYLCLGINRIERKAVALKLHEGRTRQQQPVL